MSDLLDQLQESGDEAARLGDQFVLAGQRIVQAQEQCGRVLKDCQARFQPTQAHLQSFQDRLQQRAQTVDATSQQLIEQCRQVSAWAQNNGLQLSEKYAESRTQLAQATAQMAQSQSQLDQQRLLLSATMMQDVELLRDEAAGLVGQLQATQKFMDEQLLPGLQQRQVALEQQSQQVRNLVLNQLLPGLTQEFESTRQHLARLSESLVKAGKGNAEASKLATLAALESLGKALDGLCARSAEITQNSLEKLAANTSPVRSRAEDLSKQGKIFQEIGTPASGHLKILVNVVIQLQDLLVQAKVLSPG